MNTAFSTNLSYYFRHWPARVNGGMGRSKVLNVID